MWRISRQSVQKDSELLRTVSETWSEICVVRRGCECFRETLFSHYPWNVKMCEGITYELNVPLCDVGSWQSRSIKIVIGSRAVTAFNVSAHCLCRVSFDVGSAVVLNRFSRRVIRKRKVDFDLKKKTWILNVSFKTSREKKHNDIESMSLRFLFSTRFERYV